MQATSGDLIGLWLEFQIERSRKLTEEFHELLVSAAEDVLGAPCEAVETESERSAA
jgi:hypothetical protein